MDWEIYDGVKQRGPMPEAEVYEVIRAGLPRNAYVRPRGTSDWRPVDSHPPFAAALQTRGAPGQWPPPPPPPPPPALVGAPPPPQPVVAPPPPGTAFAVSPDVGRPAPRRLRVGGCLVQCLGALLLVGAGGALYASVGLVVQALAGIAALGLVLLLVGGLLSLKWVCGQCHHPVARSTGMCPSCRASLT